MSGLLRHGWRAAVLTAAVVTGSVLASVPAQAAPAESAAAAAAANCGVRLAKANGEGVMLITEQYNLKAGPYGACDHVRRISPGTTFYLWCTYTNDYGNDWYYGRIAGTQTYGWAAANAFGPVLRIEDDNDDGVLRMEYCPPG